MTDERRVEVLSEGGDAACWLSQVCAECGAMLEAPLPTACWRCGAEAFPQDAEALPRD